MRRVLLFSALLSACSPVDRGGPNDGGDPLGANGDPGTGSDPGRGDPIEPSGDPSTGGDPTTVACGTCPSGYDCSSANGIPVCRKHTTGIPLFDHVVVIVMENTSLDTLQGASNTPYLSGLFTNAAWADDYHGVAHPSLPNYLAITSGTDHGVQCDCDPSGTDCNSLTCNGLVSLFVSCGCNQGTVNHIGTQLDAAHLTWADYAEGFGDTCNMTTAGGYATRHVPFLYYGDVSGDATRCTDHVIDYTSLDPAHLPSFTFVSPNLTDDMHDPVPATDTNLANGDGWLQNEVGRITGGHGFTDKSIVFIVWDEDDLSGLIDADAPIPLFVISPLAKQSGYESPTHADHYALLATFEDGLGLQRLGNAGSATPLEDFFPDN